MRDVLKSGFVLLVITVLAGFGLGAVYEITKEKIASQSLGAIAESLGVVLPEADSYAETEITSGYDNISAVYEGEADGAIVGYVINIGEQGYAGVVETLVAIDTSGVITGVEVVNHTETPGLGSNATEPEFLSQYIGRSKNQKVVKAAPGNDEIQAVASATITSTTVTTCVNNALDYYYDNLGDPSARPEDDSADATGGDLKSSALPKADSFEEIDVAETEGIDGITVVYKGTSSGEEVGYVIGAGYEGYGGIVECLVGIDSDGVITGVEIAEHSETPGLGSAIEEAEFRDQYVGRSSNQYVVTEAPGNDDILAVASATVSSIAVTVSVNNSLKYFNANLSGVVSDTTSGNEPVAKEAVEVSEDALKAVLEADTFESLDIAGGYEKVNSVYIGTAAGETVGYVICAGAEGFSGIVETLVAMDTEGVVTGVEIVSQTETEGLGSKIEDEEFLNKFIGKSNKQYVVTEAPGTDEIQAISGATVSTVAVVLCVNDAVGYFKDNLYTEAEALEDETADDAEVEDEAATEEEEAEDETASEEEVAEDEAATEEEEVTEDTAEETAGVSEELLSGVLAAESFEALDIAEGYDKISSVYKGTSSDETVGYVIGLGAEGFSGIVETLVAIDAEGVITGVEIVSQTETEGLGSNIEDEEFLSKFVGRSNKQYVVTEAPGTDEIQAISGATVSTAAVAICVNDALGYYGDNLNDEAETADESAEARESAELPEDALSDALAEADSFEAMEIAGGFDSISAVYVGTSSEETTGYVISNGAEGYGGIVESLIALDADGTVVGVQILSHSETDGIGSLVDDPEFLDQFIGKTKKQYVVTEAPGNDEILAVSHATVSSIAVTLSVNSSLDYFDKNLREAE